MNENKVVQHESIVPCDWYEQPYLDELSKSLRKSGKKYLCPLCTDEKYKPAWPSKVKKHLKSHDHSINLKDYSISVLACHLDCRAKKKDKHAHYHCPSCYKTLARKDGFYTHWEECKQYYTAPSDLAKDEDSGYFPNCDEDTTTQNSMESKCCEESMNNYPSIHRCTFVDTTKKEDSGYFPYSDDDTTTENRMESKYCEESMNSVPSIQTNSYDIPDVSYLSHGTHTNSESVICTEEHMMDTSTSSTGDNTEGITMDNITTPSLSEPVAETLTNIPRKDIYTVDYTCTPVEESSQITTPDPSLPPFTSKQSQSSFESQPETVEQSYADLNSSIILSVFQGNRRARQDFGLSYGQESVSSSLNEDGNDKMECGMALNMIECQAIIKELSLLDAQKTFDDIEGLDQEGKCFDGGVDDYLPLSNDPGGIYEGSEKKVENCEDFPGGLEVDLPLRAWEINNPDMSFLDLLLHGDGDRTLEDISVHGTTEMSEIDIIKMNGQLDRTDRVDRADRVEF